MTMRILIAVTNDLETDQRILKTAKTLQSLGHDIVLIGRKLKASNSLSLFCSYKRFGLCFNKQFWFYANYNLRLFSYLLFKKHDVIIANDLDTLPACFLASKIRSKKLIYDSHEYFTEVPELINTGFQRNFWLFLENIFVPKLKVAYSVSESISLAYREKYGVNFGLVRNLPLAKKCNPDIQKNTEPTIIYQGALNVGRGVELMIDAMVHLNTFHLWIAGTGDIDLELKEKVNQLKLADRVKFLGRVNPEKLHKITQQAHLGFSLEEDRGLNYRFALPNKLFDYIQARIPVIVSDLPEMKQVVVKYQIGEVLQERTPKALAALIESMYTKQSTERFYNKNMELAARELCWEKEQEKLVEQFTKAISK